MTKKTTISTLFIVVCIYGTVQIFQYLNQQIGVEYTSMAIAYAALFLLLWQLLRLIRAVNHYKRTLEQTKVEMPKKPAPRWQLGRLAPSRWSVLPMIIFGQRTFTWEELIPIYLFLAGILWAFRFILVTVL